MRGAMALASTARRGTSDGRENLRVTRPRGASRPCSFGSSHESARPPAVRSIARRGPPRSRVCRDTPAISPPSTYGRAHGLSQWSVYSCTPVPPSRVPGHDTIRPRTKNHSDRWSYMYIDHCVWAAPITKKRPCRTHRRTPFCPTLFLVRLWRHGGSPRGGRPLPDPPLRFRHLRGGSDS